VVLGGPVPGADSEENGFDLLGTRVFGFRSWVLGWSGDSGLAEVEGVWREYPRGRGEVAPVARMGRVQGPVERTVD
jgi:hypothetical protein